MPRREENKFDPATSDDWAPQKCSETLEPRLELFLKFCRRALGTSDVAPLVLGREALNGASMKALSDIFEVCCPPAKQFAPKADSSDRRAALEKAAE